MSQPGTGVQLEAIGPQDTHLSINPEVTYFRKPVVRSSRFASEDHEERPNQSTRFGAVTTFRIKARGELLGDVHVQFRVPAVQPALGLNVPRILAMPPVLETARPASSGDVTFAGVRVLMSGLPGSEGDVLGTVSGMRDVVGQVWTFSTVDVMWKVCIYETGHVISTLTSLTALTTLTTLSTLSQDTPPNPCVLRVERGARVLECAQVTGCSVSVVVTASGIHTANDTWGSPLARVLTRRVRLLIDEVVVHDHERVWYDMLDQLHTTQAKSEGMREMLGTGLSMGAEHTVMLPLKFLCSSAHTPRAYLPLVLLSQSTVQVEVHLEEFARAVPAVLCLSVLEPPVLDVCLVAEHVYLEHAERTALLHQSVSVVYEDAQDADGLNYVPVGDGSLYKSKHVTIELTEFNLPVKSLVWVVYDESMDGMFEYLDVVDSAELLFGSLERMRASGTRLSRQQLWSHGTRCLPGNVYMYSFALRAFGAAPNGSANFSALPKAQLRLTLSDGSTERRLKVKVWATTYNWLTFSRGRVSQAFSA